MKYLKYVGLFALGFGILFSIAFFVKSNSTSAIQYETQTLITATIEDKIVATGKVLPEDEVNVVPQIAGIIQELYVEEGDEILISTNKGRVIRVAVKEIRTAGRNTQGVRIIKLSGEEKVVSAIKIDDNLI